MPEPVLSWWARRQFSRGADVPYAVGTYREAWQSFPALIRQYHPELNAGITLTQIPPLAEVLLQWQCEAGHIFVATPEEQRTRPGRERRRSAWCPDCSALAKPARVRTTREPPPPAPPVVRRICAKTPELAVGEPFASVCAPKPASAVEGELRTGLAERLEFAPGFNAVRLARPFFDHLEVWPDIVIPELRVAVEFDSTGRHGLEHVGNREQVDRRKDRAVRGVRWEVIRVRTGKLPALGPYDLQVAGVNRRMFVDLIDRLRAIRGLVADAYLR
jgi:Probable Zinc-ribbon domain